MSLNQTFGWLSSAQVAPPLKGLFEGGRVEGWLHGCQPLTLEMMREPMVSRAIARASGRNAFFNLPHLRINRCPNFPKVARAWTVQAMLASGAGRTGRRGWHVNRGAAAEPTPYW